MKILLAYPAFPTTYWGFQHSLRVLRKRSSLPPLGLVTLAAVLPSEWQLRLVDLNVRPLTDADIRWADAVFAGGMLVQEDSLREIVRRAQALDRPVVVGGPGPTTCPDHFADADVVFCGEVEGRVDELVAAVHAAGGEPQVLAPPTGRFPALAELRVPRYELLDMSSYVSMSLQYSRGCPFNCEFCDVIEIFGRKPRVKETPQVLAELDALYQHGYRGSIFFVDDNFIGNRAAVRRLLPEIEHWQAERNHPFEMYTEASVNLASDETMVRGMVAAGFTSVFLGIETPSREALEAAGKKQNLALECSEAIERLTRWGLEVMGGFIVGFDSDDERIFDAQRQLIGSSPVALAMVGLLHALPGTALWRRMSREGRLRRHSAGDQFGRPNFRPAMDERALLGGYRDLLRDLYSPKAYYSRCRRYVERAGLQPAVRSRGLVDLTDLGRAIWHVGILSERRWLFWKLIATSLIEAPHTTRRAVAHAVMGEHLIRYTREHVLPRLQASIAEIDAERRGARAAAPAMPPAGLIAAEPLLGATA